MLVKSCRKLKTGSLCSCFSSQKPPSRVNRLQTQGFPQRPLGTHASVVEEPSVCPGCLPLCLLPFPLPSQHFGWQYLGTPTPPLFPPVFSIFTAALSLLFFDFGHPQRRDENSRREGSRGWARLPKARLPQAPVSSCVQARGVRPGQVPPPHRLCIQGLTMTPGTQG